MNYSDPNATIRQIVTDCKAACETQSASLDSIITALHDAAATAGDSTTAQTLTLAANSMSGNQINLNNEANRLGAIIAGWPAA